LQITATIVLDRFTTIYTRRLVTATHNFRKKAKLVDWAKRELELAGLFDKDSDYGGALGPAILEMVKTFSEQGHSGFSAGMTRTILNKLLNWEPLTPVTDPLAEGYEDVSKMWGDGKKHYQCTRDSSIFSEDGGKTWTKTVADIYEDENGISYTRYRQVPLEVYNKGEGHSIDYRGKDMERLAKKETRDASRMGELDMLVRDIVSCLEDGPKTIGELSSILKENPDRIQTAISLDKGSRMKFRGNKVFKLASEEILSRFEEGKPADPTENMSPEDAKEWWEQHEKNKDRFKTASRVVARYKKNAGFSYATEIMSVLFVEGRKPVPFNIDTIRAINDTTIPTIADDNELHDLPLQVIGHKYSGPLTYPQEKMGMRRETRVDIRFPIDEEGSVDTSERATLAALARVGKRFGFKVEPSRPGYDPKTRKASGEEEDDDWGPNQKRGEWNLAISKYSPSRWRFFLRNPLGGGFGSGSYSSAKTAFYAAVSGVAWGEERVNPKGKDKIWVIQKIWNPEIGNYELVKKYWWNIPDELMQKKFSTPSREQLEHSRSL
jgi:hypothetical protein